MLGKNSSSNDNEEKIIKIIKEACRMQNLKPEDWNKYGPNVNYNNILIIIQYSFLIKIKKNILLMKKQ